MNRKYTPDFRVFELTNWILLGFGILVLVIALITWDYIETKEWINQLKSHIVHLYTSYSDNWEENGYYMVSVGCYCLTQ